MSLLTVMLLDTEPQTNNFYITLAIRDALRADRRVGKVVLANHADAVGRMQAERFDLFLAFGGSVRHHLLLRRLAALAGTSVLWTTEDPYESRGNIAFSDCFDLVFTNDRGSLSRYSGCARHLPLAASESFQDLPVRADDALYRYDLLFVGTAWPNRVETINRILAAFPDSLKVKIALPWNQYLPKPRLVRPDLLFDWRCSNEDFARFANMSRVVLTLTRAFSASAVEHASGTTPPPRLFEVALAGGAQLVVQPDPEIRDYYREGDEIRISHDEGRILGDIRALLDDAPARIAMAEGARSRTQREHLYAHRIDTILNAVAERMPAPTPPLAAVNARPRILFVAHNRAGQRASGGIEFYQEQLAQALAAYDVVFLYPVQEGGRHFLRVDDGQDEETIPIRFAERLLSDPEIESVFQRILGERQIDLVHFHHLLHLPLSLPLIARALGVPTVFQLHDFYLVCSRFNLMNHHGVFCDVVNRGREQCDGCLLTAENIPVGAKARRDGFVAELVDGIDAFVASTPYSADYVRSFFPEMAESRLSLIEMVDFGAAPESAAAAGVDVRREAPLRIAVLGNIVDHKGAKTLVELIRITRGQGYVFELLGYVETYLVNEIQGLSGELVRVRGGYVPEEVPALLRGCDVSLHLSVWPETYMISLTEAWRAGLVPIVTDLGAQGERVCDGLDGLKVPPMDAGAVLRALRRLRHDHELMRSLRAAIARKSFPTMADHAGRMTALYTDLIRGKPVAQADLSDRPLSHNLTTFDLGLRLNALDWTSGLNIWDRRESGQSVAGGTPLDAIPQADGLPEHDLPADGPDLSWELSEIVVDGQRLDGRRDKPVVADTLGLAGWLWRAVDVQPSEMVLRLRAASGSSVYVGTTQERRPDLAARFGDARAEFAGFSGSFDTAGLAAGAYALDLLHILPDQVAVARDVLAFTVADASGGQMPMRWSHPQPIAMAEIGPGSPGQRVAVVAHSFQTIAGRAVARQGSVVRFALRWSERDAMPGPVRVGLCRDGAVSWIETQSVRDEDGLLVRIEARADGLESADHRIIVRRLPDGGWIDAGLDVYVTASPRAYLLADKPPAGLPTRRVRKKGGRPSFDRVLVEQGARSLGASTVRAAGWAFVAGRGRPLGYVARWGSGTDRRLLIADAIPRQDVAVHLKNRSAVMAGFEIEVPLGALGSDAFGFAQIYDDGVVDFPNFANDLHRALGWSAPSAALARAPKLVRPLLRRRGQSTRIGRYLTKRAARRSADRQRERAVIAESGIFRDDWYARQGRRSGDPILDYLLFGANAGHDPHPLFDTDWYLRRYPDVAAAGLNPLVHYLTDGWKEARDPGPLFSSRWYTEQHAEITRDTLNPLVHYVATGAARGDVTTPYFDAHWYRKAQDGPMEADRAFTHYIEQGVADQRPPSAFHDVVPTRTSRRTESDAPLPFRHWLDDPGAGEISQISGRGTDTSAGSAAGRMARLAGMRVAVIAHVYYPDLWPQLATAICRIPIDFDLFVTCPAERKAQIDALVGRAFPGARIIATANRGRDVAPFFEGLRAAEETADYTAICKVHTKRGTTEPKTWRHMLLESVLGSPALVSDIVRSFGERPKLGLVGARELYLSGSLFSKASAAQLHTLLQGMLPDATMPDRWGFVAGTMFWIHPALAKSLRLHVETHVDFEADNASGDGQIAHALERMFGLSAVAAGFEIGLVDLLPGQPIPHALTIHPSPVMPREERPEIYLARKALELKMAGFPTLTGTKSRT